MDPNTTPHLPAEVLLMILSHLPQSFFQQDIGRLTISKRWYAVAFPLFSSRIEFTPRVINRLVHNKSPSLDQSRALLRKTLRSINIVLNGLDPSPSPAAAASRAHHNSPNNASDPDPYTARSTTLANLSRFSGMLFSFHQLTDLRFTARSAHPSWPADPHQHPGYLPEHTLSPYFTLPQVTSLDLDLCGSEVLSYSRVPGRGCPVHFCPHIAPLLARLRSLKLRTRRICCVALQPVEGQPVTLQELRLSLYLGRVSDHNAKLNSSKKCLHWDDSGLVSPLEGMRASLEVLVQFMAEPKRAELVHLAPSGEVRVWDALTGACTRDLSEEPRKFTKWAERDFRWWISSSLYEASDSEGDRS